jgi:hypothetical protein
MLHVNTVKTACQEMPAYNRKRAFADVSIAEHLFQQTPAIKIFMVKSRLSKVHS